jgi:hypothetical protein
MYQYVNLSEADPNGQSGLWQGSAACCMLGLRIRISPEAWMTVWPGPGLHSAVTPEKKNFVKFYPYFENEIYSYF